MFNPKKFAANNNSSSSSSSSTSSSSTSSSSDGLSSSDSETESMTVESAGSRSMESEDHRMRRKRRISRTKNGATETESEESRYRIDEVFESRRKSQKRQKDVNKHGAKLSDQELARRNPFLDLQPPHIQEMIQNAHHVQPPQKSPSQRSPRGTSSTKISPRTGNISPHDSSPAKISPRTRNSSPRNISPRNISPRGNTSSSPRTQPATLQQIPPETENVEKKKRLKSSPMTITRKDRGTKPDSGPGGSAEKAKRFSENFAGTSNIGSAPPFAVPRLSSAGDVKRRKSRSSKRMSTGSPEKKIEKVNDSDKEDEDAIKKDKSPVKEKEKENGEESPMKSFFEKRPKEEDTKHQEAEEKEKAGKSTKSPTSAPAPEEKSFFNLGSMMRKKEGNREGTSTGLLYKFSHLKTSKVYVSFQKY